MTAAQNTIIVIPEEKSSSASFRKIISSYLYHWPLFAVGMLAAIVLATFYVKLTNPEFTVNATMIIKDVKKSPDQSALSEIDLMNSSSLVENETEVLKSMQLMSKVVSDLQLNVIYKTDEGLKSAELYKSSPVKLVLIKPNDKIVKTQLNVVLKDKNTFALKDADGKTKNYPFNQLITTSVGLWRLETTTKANEYFGRSINITVLDPEGAALHYRKGIDVSIVNKLATIIVLSMNDDIPQRGKDILNQLIFNYNLLGSEEKATQIKNTLDYLDQKLMSVSQDLTVAEKGIEGYKSSRGLTDMTSDIKTNLDGRQLNDTRMIDVSVQLSVIEGLEKYINTSGNFEKAPATVGITDPALASLIEKLSLLQLQREKLLATTPETNPDFEPLNKQIAGTKEAIKENISYIKSSLLSTKQRLSVFTDAFETSIKNMPTQERQLVSIKRQQEIKEHLYTYLLQKREEVAISYASTISNERIVDPAYVGPVKGSKKMIALSIVAILGFFMPVGIIYGRSKLQNTITTVDEIKDAINLPVAAQIPAGNSPSATAKLSGTIIGEHFRLLRTKLYFMNAQTPARGCTVTLVTSGSEGEGKTFISTNLATALANINKKTIIIELDLRKPQLLGIYNLDANHKGITDYLNGKAALEQIIQKSASNSDLHMISSGGNVDNPSDLLQNGKIVELIAMLRESYDHIILDTPPVHLVSDTLIMAHLADITLFVMRQGVTIKDELLFCKNLNDKNELPNMKIIFNGVSERYGQKTPASYYTQEKKRTLYSNFWSRF